jgi:hypothetical protein
MNAQDDTAAEKPPPSLWKRLLLAGAAFALLLTALGVGVYVTQRGRAGKAQKDAEALLDEADPGWRRFDLEAARDGMPELQNSARVVLAAGALRPKGRPDYRALQPVDEAPGLPPHLLDAGRLAALRSEMAAVGAAVAEARRLAEMPRGRHPLFLADNPFATLLPHVQTTREVASLLRYDALLLAQEGRPAEALRSCRAVFNAAGSLGDEPFMISQLVRIAIVAIGCAAVEKVLALGEAPADDLARLQEMLRQEDRHRTLWVALRGERAMLHDVFLGVAAGRIRLSEVAGPAEGGPAPTFTERYFGWVVRDLARRDHPKMLALMNKAVENANLPPHEQAAAEEALEKEVKEAAASPLSLLRLLLPAMSKFADATRRKTASVRCLDALLAVERYRLDNGSWPAKLADVTRKYLPAVPLDPFDGKPLRFLRTRDGVVVYSVGKDGKDDGGLIRPAGGTGLAPDQGYQLWDKDKRRQPPPKGAGPGGPP